MKRVFKGALIGRVSGAACGDHGRTRSERDGYVASRRDNARPRVSTALAAVTDDGRVG